MATKLTPRLVKWPAEPGNNWLEAIDRVRGDVPVSVFVRDCVLRALEAAGAADGLRQPAGRGCYERSTG